MGYLAAFVAFVVWGVTSALLNRLIPQPAAVLTCAGAAIGTAGMLALIGPRKWPEVVRAHREHFWRLLAMGGCFAGCSLTYQWALKTTTVANAVLTHSLQPVLTCLVFLPLAGKGPPTAKGFAALALGIGGLAILLWPELTIDGPFFGIVMGLASAAFFSGFIVLMPKTDGKIDRDVLQTCNLLATTVLILPFAGAQYAQRATAHDVGLMALLGVLTFVVANRFYYYALKKAPLGHVATFAYLEPVVSIAVAAMFLGEPVTPYAAIGGAVVIASGALVMFDKPSKLKTAP